MIDAIFNHYMAELFLWFGLIGLLGLAAIWLATREKSAPVIEPAPRLLEALDRLFTSGAVFDPEDNPTIREAIRFAMREAGKAKGMV